MKSPSNSEPSKSQTHQLLDEIVLRAVPLSDRANWKLEGSAADLRALVRCDGDTHTDSAAPTLMLPTPFIVRGLLNVDPRQPLVTKVTAAIHRIGGMLLADAATFSKMPISSLPRRICAVRSNSMPAVDELHTADAIELQLIDDCSGCFLKSERPVVLPKWPSDVPDVERLKTKIQLLRKLSGAPIPVGVAMLASDVQRDVATMVGCGVDFISLLMPLDSARVPIPWIVRTARQAVIKAGHPQLSIWIEADVRDGWDMAKLFACGASAIILDPVIRPWVDNEDLPEETLSSSGIRRSTGLATRDEVVEAYLASLRGKLVELTQQIQKSLQLCGCGRLAELTIEHLVATTQRAGLVWRPTAWGEFRRTIERAHVSDRIHQRYAVLGTGALGGYYGGLLSRSGQEVHFLLHSDFEHVRQHGLRVESPKGDFLLQSTLAHASVDSIPKCDVIVVALKSTQNELLSEFLPKIVHDRSSVVVLQNGLYVEEATAAIVGHRRTIGGCCFLCSNKVGPGHIRHLDYGRIILGAYRGIDDVQPRVDEACLRSIAEDFRNASIEVEVTDDFAQARWKKLMWNIPFNGLSVVLNASTAELMQHPSGRQMALEMMQEVRSIACQCGHEIDETLIDKLMSDTDKMVPYDSSMRLDYLLGRPMEVEAIVGNPLRAAQMAGVNPPRLRLLWQQLSFLDRVSRIKKT